MSDQDEEGVALNGTERSHVIQKLAQDERNGGSMATITEGVEEPPNQNDRRHGRRISIAGGVVFHHYSSQNTLEGINDDNRKEEPSEDVAYRDAITLPQSTHTLLYTEKVLSIAYGFAVLIVGVSITCLALALADNLSGGTPGNPFNIPINVSPSVRAAQYFSLIVAVIMEEEIPTGLFLLRTIPKSSLENKLGTSYIKFVVSALFRLVIGYLFLFNVLLVIVQSERVLDMFYDMLALQFVSMIDDIAFRLAQLDILGKHLRNATSATCFLTEFERKPYLFRKKMTIFVKCIYSLNFLTLLGLVIHVGALQKNGHFQCSTVTVTFGEEIWEKAWVTTSDEDMVLVYSYFNGVYAKDGTHAGRPVYRELKKSEDEPFETRIGAELKYCEEESAWVFTHENIRKTHTSEESSCPWLLRSPDTIAYDLMDVSGEWEIWVGVINQKAKMSVTCNECNSDTECNLNGVCTDHKCVCTNPAYLSGSHCELETPCPRIISEIDGTVWSVVYAENCEHIHEYGSPVYSLIQSSNMTGVIPIDVNDRVSLVYSGSRWLEFQAVGGRNISLEKLQGLSSDYHAFWNEAYDIDTVAVSDPTTGSTPVGVDFYRIGERGVQHGPWGVLYPFQEPPGRGVFRCDTTTKVTEAELCKNQTMLR